jgi:hypothetical protein
MPRAPRFCKRRNPVVKGDAISADLYRGSLRDERGTYNLYVIVKKDGSDRYWLQNV